MSEDQDFQKHHQPKPCSFCAGMAGYAPLDEMDRHGVGVYFCHKCSAEYLYYQSGDLASTSLYTEINGKMYRWTVTTCGSAALWYVKTPGIPAVRKNEGLVIIKDFDIRNGDVIHHLTPENVNEKLRTWLVFL